MKGRATGVWLVLWGLLGTLMVAAMFRADRAFQSYLTRGSSDFQTACELLPADVSMLASNGNFVKEWEALKKLHVYRMLASTGDGRGILDAWKLGAAEPSPFEKWLLQCWGNRLVLAWSADRQTLFIMSPLEDRGACLKWLGRILLSAHSEHLDWAVKNLGARRYLEVDASRFLSQGFNARFHLVRGVAVTAISRKKDAPIEITQMNGSSDRSLARSADFSEFLRRVSRQRDQIFGVFRWAADDKPAGIDGMGWALSSDGDGSVHFEVQILDPAIQSVSTTVHGSGALAGLRQVDDLASGIFCWKDGRVVWDGCLRQFPKKWGQSLREMQPPPWLKSHQAFWDPVFAKLGDAIYIGFGDVDFISDKYRVAIPRTVAAIPLADKAAFLGALEATVLKCNQEQDARLVIRKTVRAYGEYYEVRMGSSRWRQENGLKELPLVAFSKGLVILSLGAERMERVLQQANAEPLEQAAVDLEGVDLRIQMKKSGDMARAFFAIAGAVGALGEEDSADREILRAVAERIALLEQFGGAKMTLTHQPGRLVIRGMFAP